MHCAVHGEIQREENVCFNFPFRCFELIYFWASKAGFFVPLRNSISFAINSHFRSVFTVRPLFHFICSIFSSGPPSPSLFSNSDPMSNMEPPKEYHM